VEGRSTFVATRNATIAVAKWGVTREFFLATCNATNVALQVARKIASCNMAFSSSCGAKLKSFDHARSILFISVLYKSNYSSKYWVQTTKKERETTTKPD